MASAWILAIDQGTTNTKALLVDREGQAVFRTSAPLDLLLPRPGYVEQDPLALWQSVRQVIVECVKHSADRGVSIAGIAITNQRETSLAWRRAKAGSIAAGEPLCNAITWQCRRSASICERVRPHASTIQAVTGLPLDPLLSATKWAWALEELPGLRAAAKAGELFLGTVDSWLLFNLTGGRVHATDHTNASRTALLSLESLGWDSAMLDLFGIPGAALPKVQPSSSLFGECVSIPGLAGVPIVSMIGDSHAAIVGHGHYQPGTVKATYGTGSSLMMLTPGLVRETSVLARTVAWSRAEQTQFALEGNIAMSGAAVQWVGEFLGLAHPVEDASALAATVPDAGGVILVPAMVGLGAPHWDSVARGILANLERSHTSAHLARAATDAIAFQVADVLEAMEEACGVKLPELHADGGATRNNMLMQTQADLLQRPVYRSTQEDLSALGAAMLGGVELGWWNSFEDLASLSRDEQSFEPHMPAEQKDALRKSWSLAVRRARLR